MAASSALLYLIKVIMIQVCINVSVTLNSTNTLHLRMGKAENKA